MLKNNRYFKNIFVKNNTIIESKHKFYIKNKIGNISTINKKDISIKINVNKLIKLRSNNKCKIKSIHSNLLLKYLTLYEK